MSQQTGDTAVTRVRGRRVWIALGAFLFGGAQVGLAALADGWAQGALLNVGSAFLLVAPLVWIERELERSETRTHAAVGELREQVVAAQAQIQQLQEMQTTVQNRERERVERRAAEVRGIGDRPSATGLVDVLKFANDEHSVSRAGIRVRIDPHVYVYLRFALSDDGEAVAVVVERRDGAPVARLTWTVAESAADLVLRMSDQLRAASLHPGATFDGGTVFTSLCHSIEVARQAKEHVNLVENLSDAQELCGHQWMIYDWGLGCCDIELPPYVITNASLHERDWLEHMVEKPWLDEDEFRYALQTARLLHSAGRLPD